MPRPRAENRKQGVSLRIEEDDYLVLRAVVWALECEARDDDTIPPSSINTSEWMRGILVDAADALADGMGGREALLDRYRDARVHELEAQLETERSGANRSGASTGRRSSKVG